MNGPTPKVQMKGTPECDILVSRLLSFETFTNFFENLGIGFWKVWSQKKSLIDLIVCCWQWKGTNAQNFRDVFWTSRASLTVRIRYELEKRLRSLYIEPKSDHCLASGTNIVNLVKAVKGRQKFFLYRHQKILVSSHSHECTIVNATSLELFVSTAGALVVVTV